MLRKIKSGWEKRIDNLTSYLWNVDGTRGELYHLFNPSSITFHVYICHTGYSCIQAQTDRQYTSITICIFCLQVHSCINITSCCKESGSYKLRPKKIVIKISAFSVKRYGEKDDDDADTNHLIQYTITETCLQHALYLPRAAGLGDQGQLQL